MVIKLKQESEIKTVVDAAVASHGTTEDALIPILTEVNNKLGFLPEQAMAEISRSLRLPQSHLYSTASFYRMLSTKPRGKHIIKFCESAPCHIMGGRKLWQALQKELGLTSGETSADGQWTVLATSCPGICGVGPVLMIDDEVYGNVTPKKLPEILAQYQQGGK
jgi:NADH-quinone oxidoreductase subunit E